MNQMQKNKQTLERVEEAIAMFETEDAGCDVCDGCVSDECIYVEALQEAKRALEREHRRAVHGWTCQTCRYAHKVDFEPYDRIWCEHYDKAKNPGESACVVYEEAKKECSRCRHCHEIKDTTGVSFCDREYELVRDKTALGCDSYECRD